MNAAVGARLRFVVPAGLDRPTGGNRYDAALARALTGLGADVELCGLPGAWPDPAATDRELLTDRLSVRRPVLVDGLIACGAPESVAAAGAAGSAVHVLVHLPLGADPGLDAATAADRDGRERASLAAAAGVLATSTWAAGELHRRHGRHGVVVSAVAPPGADPAAPAHGSIPPLVRQLATVSPLKDQLAVVAALAGVRHLAWTAELTGAVDVHPRYVAAVRAAIERHGLSARIRLTGPLLGEELERAWAETDLLLLPSRVETWGLVVTEALAHGVPVVVSAGTGAVEALGRAPDGRLPGAHVPPGDTAALARSIAALLADGGAARRAALARRGALPGWRRTARTVLAALGEAA